MFLEPVSIVRGDSFDNLQDIFIIILFVYLISFQAIRIATWMDVTPLSAYAIRDACRHLVTMFTHRYALHVLMAKTILLEPLHA